MKKRFLIVLFLLPILLAGQTLIELSSGWEVDDADVAASATRCPIYWFRVLCDEYSGSQIYISSVTFNTSGTYEASDITSLQLWTADPQSGGTWTNHRQVGSSITTGLGPGSHTFSLGTSLSVDSGSLCWYWLMINTASTIGSGNTIYVTAQSLDDYSINNDDILFGSSDGNPTVFSPGVTLRTSNPAIAAANLAKNSTKNPVYKFTLVRDNTSGTCNLNKVYFNTTGTYDAGDITKFQLWTNTSNSLSGATQVGSDLTTTLGPGGYAHLFDGLSQSLTVNSTRYFWITTDVASDADTDSTLTVPEIEWWMFKTSFGYEWTEAFDGGTQTFKVPAVTLASSNPALAADVTLPGDSKHPIYKFTLEPSTANATITQLNFSSAGTYAAADLSKFQLWYASSDDFSSASSLGTGIVTGLGAGSHSFSSISQTVPYGSTGYFWITADIASGATIGKTISVDALTTTDITLQSGTKSGTAYAGGAQTIAHYVTVSSGDPSLNAGNVDTGTEKHPIGKFTLEATGGSTTLTAVTITTSGTYQAADISNLKLWTHTSNDFSAATQLGSTITSSLGSGTHSFTDLSRSLAESAVRHFWVTADIKYSAGVDNTIRVNGLGEGDFVTSDGAKTGSSYAAGYQTVKFVSLATDQYRTQQSGYWSVSDNWESSRTGSNWYDATLVPGSEAGNIYLEDEMELDADEECGDITFNSGNSLNFGNYNLTVNGDVVGAPVFYYNGSGSATNAGDNATIHLSNPVPATLPSSMNELELDIGPMSVLSLPNDISVSTLTLTSGAVSLNSFSMMLADADFAVSSPFCYLLTLSVNKVNSSNDVNGTQSIARTWTTGGNISGYVNVTLRYPKDLTTDAPVTVWMGSGENWTFMGEFETVVNGGWRSVSFGPIPNLESPGKAPLTWTITGEEPLLPVVLSAFLGSVTAQETVMLQWVTQSETGLAGYYILRAEQENLEQALCVSSLIAAENGSSAQSYSFVDADVLAGQTYWYWLQSVDLGGAMDFHGPVSVYLPQDGDVSPEIPLFSGFQRVFPNPFNPTATVVFGLKDATRVNISIYNLRGELVRTMLDAQRDSGTYHITWDGRSDSGTDCPTGIYLLKLNAGNVRDQMKVVLQK